MFDINIHRMKKLDGTPITDLLMNSQDIFLTEWIINNNTCLNSIDITENKPGGFGGISISAQYSKDKIDVETYWRSQDGILIKDTDLSISPISNTKKLIEIPFRLAKYMRFQLLAITDSKITLDLWSQVFI